MLRAELKLLEAWLEEIKAGYDPSQPRVPAGQPNGGQWVKIPGSGRVLPSGSPPIIGYPDRRRRRDNPEGLGKIPPYGGTPPIVGLTPGEEILEKEPRNGQADESMIFDVVFGIAGAGKALAGSLANFFSRGVVTGNPEKIKKAADSVEEYFGGAPDTFPNKHGDIIMMKDDKKIRFDVNNPHGYDPHFHIEKEVDGDWFDAGKQHHYYFEEDIKK